MNHRNNIDQQNSFHSTECNVEFNSTQFMSTIDERKYYIGLKYTASTGTEAFISMEFVIPLS